MTTLPATKRVYVEAGLPVALVAGNARYQASAGLQPRKGLGRPAKNTGVNYDELTLAHHINFFFGFGGDPSDAPFTVATLRRLVNPSSSDSLGRYVEELVSRLVLMPAEIRADIKEFWRRTGASLRLDPAEGRARIWQLGWDGDALAIQNGLVGKEMVQEFYDPEKTRGLDDCLQGPNGGAVVWRRQPVELSLTVLAVAAELLADTPQPATSTAPQGGGTDPPA